MVPEPAPEILTKFDAGLVEPCSLHPGETIVFVLFPVPLGGKLKVALKAFSELPEGTAAAGNDPNEKPENGAPRDRPF